MSDKSIMPTLLEMTNHLKHYGTKGMRWGVRRSDDGGGSIKVAGRPTYSPDEIRTAKAIVSDGKIVKKNATKVAKASLPKGTPVKVNVKTFDSENRRVERIAKLNTPARRAVNAALGTKYEWGVLGAYTAAFVGANLATGAAPAGVTAAYFTAAKVARMYTGYKVFFKNLENNPKIKTKIHLTPEEMARYSVGRDFAKTVRTESGSVKLSSMRKTQKLEIFDKEGRRVGTQTRKVGVKGTKTIQPTGVIKKRDGYVDPKKIPRSAIKEYAKQVKGK